LALLNNVRGPSIEARELNSMDSPFRYPHKILDALRALQVEPPSDRFFLDAPPQIIRRAHVRGVKYTYAEQ
jgi:hypothetical protein